MFIYSYVHVVKSTSAKRSIPKIVLFILGDSKRCDSPAAVRKGQTTRVAPRERASASEGVQQVSRHDTATHRP